MRPNLLVIGAQKAGTTSLYEYLKGHPEIYMSPKKEIHFFDHDWNWERGVPWYEGFFAGANGQQVVGEATPGYSVFPSKAFIPERAAAVVPEARLLYVVRDPVERARSAWKMQRANGTESRPFDVAIRENSLLIDRGRYATQIERWLQHYPADRLLVLVSEDLRENRQRTMEQVFRFLGVSDSHPVPAIEANVTTVRESRGPSVLQMRSVRGLVCRITPDLLRARLKLEARRRRTASWMRAGVYEAEITPEIREYVRSEVRDDVQRLRTFVGSQFNGWGIA